MERKLELTLTIVVILLVIASAIFYLFSKNPTSFTDLFKKQQDKHITITKDTHVPEPGETASESGVAMPKAAQKMANDSKKKIRSFDVIADKNSFSVEKIIVYEDDVVKINFTAKDKTYDFSIPDFGIKQSAKKGETKLVEFQAVRVGSFIFESKPVQGAILVVPAT